MKKVTVGEEEFYLVTLAPDWGSPIKTAFEIPSEVQRSWDGSESRRATGESLRLASYEFKTWVDADEAEMFRQALRKRTTERLLVPLWVGQIGECPETAWAYVSCSRDEAGSIDESSYDIIPPNAWEFREGREVFALVIAEWADGPPELELLDDEAFEVSLSFREESDLDERLGFREDENGWNHLEAQSVFPFSPDWAESPSLSHALESERERIGVGRRTALSYHGGQSKERATFVWEGGDLEEIETCVRFFGTHRGQVRSFLFPSVESVAWVQEFGADDGDIRIRDPEQIEVGDMLCLIHDSSTSVPFRVRSVAPSGGGEISITPKNPLPVTDTGFPDEYRLTRLIPARFARPRLTLTWDTDQTARVALEVAEVQKDKKSEARETLASLYKFWSTSGARRSWLVTSYEDEIEFEGETYESALVTHSAIRAGLDLEDSTTLEADWRLTPVREFFLGVKPRVWVTIQRVSVTSNKVLRTFRGELQRPKLEGRILSAEVSLLTRDLDGRLPKFRFQRPCGWALFSEGCGLDPDDWTWTATVRDMQDRAATLQLNGELPTGKNLTDNFFAYGWLEVSGLRHLIVSSTSLTGSDLAVTLGVSDINPAIEVGAQVRLVPGCDGRAVTCREKFENFENFGGHNVAAGNLSLVKVSKDVGGGKK